MTPFGEAECIKGKRNRINDEGKDRKPVLCETTGRCWWWTLGNESDAMPVKTSRMFTIFLHCLRRGENYSTGYTHLFLFLFSLIFISWRLITSQHCSGFCHTLTWISHGVTYIPHPNPPSHLSLHPIPLGLPSAPGLSICIMHPTWAGDLFHYR